MEGDDPLIKIQEIFKSKIPSENGLVLIIDNWLLEKCPK